jgi:uncharacterized protein YdeI (YjbR/CyaY-like superfamily)
MPAAGRLTSFGSAARFRAWLARHHGRRPELLVQCFKVHAAHRGLTYRDALDEALCFGWIDGVRHRVDGHSFSVRFSPRKPDSIWSRRNIARMEELIAAGRVAPAGLAVYRGRDHKLTGLYSFERAAVKLAPELGRRFRAEARAWSHFASEAPWYRKTSIFWVMSAKREETRRRRLTVLIESSRGGRRIPALTRKT